jgi:signal transduction histidine kinase
LSDPLLELPLDLTASELKSGSPAALPEGSLRQSLLSLGVEAVAVMHLQDEIIGLVGLGGQVLGQGYRQAGLLLLERMAGHSALAVKQARLIADLEDSVSKLELAYRRTVEAQEEERRSLAVEIHDDILGRLTTMSVTLRNCRNFMLKKPEQVQEWLAHVEEETQDINHRLREITQGLYPSVLNDLGLISALEAYLDTLASKPWPLTAPKAITLTAQGFQGVRLDDERLERDVYSLTRQALDNAIKHAEAEQVFIHLQRQNEGLSVTVQDTGKGLRDDPAVLMGQNGRLGLLSMQERVRAWQGTVNFSSEAGKGTTVRAFIPCEMENQASNSLQMFNQYLNRVAD